MNPENEKLYLDEICPELDKIAWHIRPLRSEDIDDIKQELKACAAMIIAWAERRAEKRGESPLIMCPKAVVQRAVRFIISGRRFCSQKRSDILHVPNESEQVLEYNDEIVEHASTVFFSPGKLAQRKMDLELLERKLGKNMRVLDMLLCGYKQGEIAKEMGMSDAEMSQHIKQMMRDIHAVLGIEPEPEEKKQCDVVDGLDLFMFAQSQQNKEVIEEVIAI